MNDVYVDLYNALAEEGFPDTFAGYNIKYYKATPICIEKNIYDNHPNFIEDYLSMLYEIEDENQAEIIVSDDMPIVDKIQQMKYLLYILGYNQENTLDLGDYYTVPQSIIKPKIIRKHKPVMVKVEQRGLFDE